jgi:uncharacterized membrane protein YfcA
MPALTATLALIIFAAGVGAGGFGALLGVGGGVFLVPFLNLVVGFPLPAAAAISLTTVIATSSTVSAGRTGQHLINLRMGMTLEVATVAGSLVGGITAHLLREATLQRLFAAVALLVAAVMLARLNQRNVILDPSIAPGRLGGSFYDQESGQTVTYRIKRLPVGLLVSFAAGQVSSLLGIGGGIMKVPALNAWCGMPMRAAAATSALMIGVTAAGGAIIYYGRGDLSPVAAAPAVLGVLLGSWIGLHTSHRVPVAWLKTLMVALLLVVAAVMFARSTR